MLQFQQQDWQELTDVMIEFTPEMLRAAEELEAEHALDAFLADLTVTAVTRCGRDAGYNARIDHAVIEEMMRTPFVEKK